MKKKLISGIMITMFLATMITVAFPIRVSAAADPVKIGIVGPKGWIQWDGLWEAAQIAKDMINKEAEFSGLPGQDGMLIYDGTPGGSLAQVELVDIDEHSVPTPDPTAGIAELTAKLTANPDMNVIIGGFRSECLIPMEQAFLDWAATHDGPIWQIAGAATDSLIAPVATDYNRYKYMFRVTPLNSTMLLGTFLYGTIMQLMAPKLASLYYGDPDTLVPTYIIAENLVWCNLMVTALVLYGAGAGLDIKGSSRPSAVATDFSADITAAKTSGAKLVIHIFSAVAGANFIKSLGATADVHFTLMGINVESQMQEFWDSVDGDCEYEAFLASVPTQAGLTDAESMNPLAKPLTSNDFWDLYSARYGHAPVYTAWGAFDGIISLNETSYDPVGSGNPSAGKGWSVHLYNNNVTGWIKHTESLGVSDGFAWKRANVGGRYCRSGILGYFSYTGTDGDKHDPYCSLASVTPLDDGVTRAVVTQWQDGRLEAIWPRSRLYSKKWMLPPGMYTLETDIAGGPLVATGIGNYNYTTSDQQVAGADLLALTEVWFQVPHWTLLEADMVPQDHFIDVYDAARIGQTWGDSETPQ